MINPFVKIVNYWHEKKRIEAEDLKRRCDEQLEEFLADAERYTAALKEKGFCRESTGEWRAAPLACLRRIGHEGPHASPYGKGWDPAWGDGSAPGGPGPTGDSPQQAEKA